jgi:hypothetical protein
MLDFRYTCPHCGQKMLCPAESEGFLCQCPNCGKNIIPQNNATQSIPALRTPDNTGSWQKAEERFQEMQNDFAREFRKTWEPVKQVFRLIFASDPKEIIEPPADPLERIYYASLCKQRGIYLILLELTWAFGFHNFYGGLFIRGLIQNCMTILAVILWIFAVKEKSMCCEVMAIFVQAIMLILYWYDINRKHDGNGRPMI